jgi:MFS transporter, putative metabolite:H+ symporter
MIGAICPNFWTLVLSRGFVGFGVSGGHIAFSLCTEFLDVKIRGIFSNFILDYLSEVILFNVFWFLGTISQSIAGWIFLSFSDVFGDYGFRYLIAFSAFPAVITLFAFPWIPESPRFLMVSGNVQEAEKVLKYVYKMNCRPYPSPEIQVEVSNNQRGNILKMFSKPLFISSILLMILWFSNSFCYYGVIILMPAFFKRRGLNIYLESFISSLAEIPGMIFGKINNNSTFLKLQF